MIDRAERRAGNEDDGQGKLVCEIRHVEVGNDRNPQTTRPFDDQELVLRGEHPPCIADASEINRPSFVRRRDIGRGRKCELQGADEVERVIDFRCFLERECVEGAFGTDPGFDRLEDADVAALGSQGTNERREGGRRSELAERLRCPRAELGHFVQQQRDDLRLIVVGPGTRLMGGYRKYVRQHGLNDVIFTGCVDYDDLPRYYQTADIFCTPATRCESFGIILLDVIFPGPDN